MDVVVEKSPGFAQPGLAPLAVVSLREGAGYRETQEDAKVPTGSMGVVGVNEKQTAQTVPKRLLILAGRKTSVTLEEPFWQALREIATAGEAV